MLRNWIPALAAFGRRAQALWRRSPAEAPEGLPSIGLACLIDHDNLLNEGYDELTGKARPWVRLDFPKFGQALSARGVGASRTVYRNWNFSPRYRQVWRRYGFKTVGVGTNCDLHVIRAAFDFVEAGCRELILVAGDGDYADAVKEIRACNVWVEVWSRSDKTARTLAHAANAIQYIDHLILQASPAPRDSHTTNADLQQAAQAASRRTS